MMNLLQCLVELLFFINFVLTNDVKNNFESVCQIDFNSDLSDINCYNIKYNVCLNKDSNEKCLKITNKGLKNPSLLQLVNKQNETVFVINVTCFYIKKCPECLNENERICDTFNSKDLKFKNPDEYFRIYFDKNKLKIYRKIGSKFKFLHALMIFLIIILIIAIVIIVVRKKGCSSIFEKFNFNENVISLKRRFNLNGKVISLKRRLSIKNNKEAIANSFQDLIGSYENLSDSSTINQSNIQCINEFKLICTNSKLQEGECNLTTNAGKLSSNQDKNRFLNILPFDQSRVKLQGNIHESDYINASYIPFFKNPSVAEYIAAQGPLPNTITDFWWMVWEQNVSVIVMLTKLFEEGRVKCEQYWPSLLNEEEESDENPDFSVLLTEETEYSSYTERKLRLINKISTKWRNIIHLQMHSWNDFGVPNLEEFEKSLYRFREITSSDNSPPYVIHCSAGVGRSGTFITIDRIMKKVLSGKPFVNISDEVLELRKYRSFMVQQKAQYIFIHKFIGYFLKKYHEKDNDCEIEENVYE